MFQRLNLFATLLLTLVLFAMAWKVLPAQPGGLGLAPTESAISWTFEVKKVGDAEFDLIFKSSLDPGWHLYSPYQEYKFGEVPAPKPMEILYESRENFRLMGKIKEQPKPERVLDEVFDVHVNQFAGKTVFTQRIRVNTEEPFTVKGVVDGQICLDYCIPFEESFSFRIQGAKIISDGEELPEEMVEEDDPEIDVADAVADPGEKTGTDVSEDAPGADKPATDRSLLRFFLIALGLGIAGIFTPCVFPMIPMNIAFFLNYRGGKSKGKFLALFYGLSIIFIYSILGLLITVIFGAEAMGVIVSHWITNVIFFLVFVFFAASFFGAFELVLPSRWVNKADAQADKGGLVGTFFMALTLVLVSFSCTAAFIGAILVEAADGTSLLKPFVGMLGFSIGFGVPFAFLALFPAALDKMPKSGGWMNSVKVVFGFVILAFGLKFLIVPDQTYHLGLLTRDLYLAIWIVLFSLMGLYLLGVYRFSHDSEVKHIGFFRLLLVIATFSFVVYLIPGLFGADLKPVSSLLPPKTSQQFDISGGGMTLETVQPANICNTPTHADFLKLPHNLKGYFDWDEAMECAKELNKPVFIDFTGHGCSNCKKMEATVWSDPRVLDRLNNDVVILALYNDDRTTLPEEKWITTPEGTVLKTIGRITRHIQQSRFGSVAVPYYVVVDHQGNMLSGPYGADYNVDNFIAFLDKGIHKHAKSNQ
jgi:thiol:disulfide interchange protein